MEFTLGLATPADDPAIRRLLAANPMPGGFLLTYEREPDFFLGCTVMNRSCQVIVGRHRPTGELAGLGCCSIRALFVNGVETEIGYLGQLRVDPRFRRRGLLTRGAAYLRELHAHRPVRAYLASIIEGNSLAHRVLVGRARPGLPTLRPLERISTLAVIVQRPRPASPEPYQVTWATAAELPEIVRFLRRQGPAKQFFPALTEAEFRDGATTRGLAIQDFALARRGGELVGVIALWDQSGYKQTVVRGYRGVWRLVRGPYGLWARLSGGQPLPAVGGQLRHAYASLICVAENRPEIFAPLLQAIYHRAAERRWGYLMVGLADRDPLLAVAARYPHVTYRSRLYSICWEDGEDFHAHLDTRIPHVELASL